MTFGAPEWFWGLLAIPVLIALFFRAEHRGAERLQTFVSARLLPRLSATVNRPRRFLRFGLQMLGLAFALVALAQPRWGYTFQEVKRKGLDLLIAVDTSRSMLSNDVEPNRLERVKLAAHDLIAQMQGDRVGLIAFAGRAFLQAPLTIDYDAALESVNDLDTTTIPEGGTNISEAIKLAVQTFGKSAMGNRAVIIFTDGEELSGDAVKTAKAAADQGVRIFTVGVGTPQGSLIPITGEGGGTTFVKDENGQVVKSKLDENRLKEVAQATGGFYLHLENGPRTMQFLYTEGLAKMQAAEIDARLSRRPIERYEWPLGTALVALAMSILMGERKRIRVRNRVPMPAQTVTAVAALLIACCSIAFGASPGLSAYNEGKFDQAYNEFQQTLNAHPPARAEDKLQFDSGAAAYKKGDYEKALESFSQALLSPDIDLQANSHYNLGNTLYQRGEKQTSDNKKLSNWTNALDHYGQTLKLEPDNKDAKENYEFVKRKIDELKKKKEEQPSPTPSPSPSPPQPKQKQRNQQDQQSQQNQQSQENQKQQQQSGGQSQQQQRNQQQQQGGQSQQQQKDQQQQSPDQQSQGQGQQKNEQQKPQKSGQSQSPSPSPNENSQKQNQKGEGEQSPSPEPGSTPPAASPSPSPGEGGGEGEGSEPSATPSESPEKRIAGQLKEASEPDSQKQDKTGEIADAEAEKEGKMSERQALALLESMKDEEAKVRLDERRAARHVYKDW
jgi:Ca-activated chloride channel homolog